VFSFGSTEILIILVVALLLFGPDKIPQLARTIGRFTREFNKYKDIMESTIRMEFNRVEDEDKGALSVEERIAKAGGASAALIEKGRADAALASAADEPDAESEIDDEVAPAAPHAVAKPSADESDEEDEG
jgi:TatA/E family protein of Tat protein translocase